MSLVKERLLLGLYWGITKYLLRNLDRFTDFTEKYCLCMRIYENYNPDLVFDDEEAKEDYNLEDEVIKYVDTEIFEEVFLPKLTDKQREVIEMRYGFCGEIPRSGLSIARTLGTIRQNVSLLEQYGKEKLKSLKKLRKFYKD